jgi:DNA-binding SARP family transcriptional activator
MPSRLQAGPAAHVEAPAEADRPSETSRGVSPERPASPRSKQRPPRIVVAGAGKADAHGPMLGSQAGSPLEYPVQLGKVQAPPLRDETLARDRLLDWLSVKIHRRVVLLVAEAGYGKTTLLADFSRRTRVRVLWFRLDRGDRDWVGFIAHLVAAIRVHLPGFGSATAALLRETATSAPSLETVLDTFLRELGGLPNDPTAFVFDDVHLVDDSPDVKHVLRELLARGPERMSFVFASRREPPIRLARLRALGEVAELGTDDLRFDAAETERLFRETYEMRLEPSVLAELSRRTEGWAASLQLVRAALHDRNAAEVRTFISSLSGAEGHLYEYLAEEVVGDLSPELQQFLMRTSLLETVDLRLGPVAAGLSEDETRTMIEKGERHGLFGRGGPNTRHVVRAHPLVRDFLQARLVRAIGASGLRGLDLAVARAAEAFDWQVSVRHYLRADDAERARQVLGSAIEQILATGAYAVAHELSGSLGPVGVSGAPGLVLRSRMAQQQGSIAEGLALAEQAWAIAPESTVVLLNLMTARALAGDVSGSLDAGRLLEAAGRSGLAEFGRVHRITFETSRAGSLDVAKSELESLSASLRVQNAEHYLGVAVHNLALLLIAKGEFERSLATSTEARSLFELSSAGNELLAARMTQAMALGFLGRIDAARGEMRGIFDVAAPGQVPELVMDRSWVEALVGDSAHGWDLIDSVSDEAAASEDLGEQMILARALLHVQDGDLANARADIAGLRHGEPRSSIAFEARRLLTEGLVLALSGAGGSDSIQSGTKLAALQGATLWERYGETLYGLSHPDRDPSALVDRAAKSIPVVLSMLAEVVVRRLPQLDQAAMSQVITEAEARPWRWRASVRRSLDSGAPPEREAAAGVLERIGEQQDVLRLRNAGQRTRHRRGPRPGYVLARRLASRVLVEDLGRVRINVGERAIEGGEVRRKVLALLCLLLSKTDFSSTREEVIDSLWPDHDPDSALNSLNQTVYFLRRVFEPEFRDDTSAGYVGQDGETIWLDGELIDCTSRRCLEIIRSMPGAPTPEASLALATEYRGRFALDFAYEDWSAPYRDALHASFLRVVEHAIRMDLDSGHFGRGTFIAERAAEVDPDAEDIQVALVRLYRHSGAHAAAAEQYVHYAQSMRDLGVEPVAFADV